MRRNKRCCYCGRSDGKLTTEHVIPRSLYDTVLHARIQRLTLNACEPCNGSFSDDEPEFRSCVTLASNGNGAAEAAFETVLRSFDKEDGLRRFDDLWKHLRPDKTYPSRHRVYPGESEACMRVVAKIVRGLHFHFYGAPIEDDQVQCSVMLYKPPSEMLEEMNYEERGADVFECWWDDFFEEDFTSVWLLRFYQNCSFAALVRSGRSLMEN